jgi:hypothetical protein
MIAAVEPTNPGHSLGAGVGQLPLSRLEVLDFDALLVSFELPSAHDERLMVPWHRSSSR